MQLNTQGTFDTNQGTFAASQGTFAASQGTFAANQGTFTTSEGVMPLAADEQLISGRGEESYGAPCDSIFYDVD
jgi:hypothetical protein